MEVCERLEILCSSPARDLASALEVMLYCGTVRHSVAVSSGCPTSAVALTLLGTAQMWRVEPRFLETIPDLCPTCLYVPCTHTTQRTTCVLFAREQEILQSCNKNPLPGHRYSCRASGLAGSGATLGCFWKVRGHLYTPQMTLSFLQCVLLLHPCFHSPESQKQCCDLRIIITVYLYTA